MEGAGVTVTWCIGHLLEQASPEHYNPLLQTWNLDLLPVVPKQWTMQVKSSVKDQYRCVATLLKKASEVVIATDADREGEVIAREVMELCGYRGPVSRLWLSAMDDASVKKALARLLPDAKTLPLYFSGMGRSRADWLAGMNLTMALTKAFGVGGKGSVLHCGRVQTPVLGLIVRREKAIAGFVPKPYFILDAKFEIFGTIVPMNWIPSDGAVDKDGHVIDRGVLDAVAAKIKGKAGRVTSVESTPEQELAPLPYSLGSLQREASRIYGMKAQAVLDACQALYEKHKATTYPRTDCEYLPLSMFGDVPGTLSAMQSANGAIRGLVASVKLAQAPRCFNDKKITAHHAIIPTLNPSVRTADMSATELKVYSLICSRYLAQFLGAYEFTKTILKVTCEAEHFSQTGRTPKVPGWRRISEVYGVGETKEKASKDADEESAVAVSLPAVKVGDQAINRVASVLSKQTKPPKRYTEGTLLGAMESIDKEIDDPRLKRIMQTKEKAGIGTDATRSAIIEGLFKREYIVAEKKNLLPTPRGVQLIELIERIEPALADPVLTALWEDQLGQIEAGTNTLQKFESDLAFWLGKIIDKIKANAGSVQVGGQNKLGAAASRPGASKAASASQHPCPACGKGLVARQGAKGPFWGCSGYPNCKTTYEDNGGKPRALVAGQTGRSSGGSTPSQPPQPVKFLSVNFDEREKVKALGARWSPERKQWFVPAGVDPSAFSTWIR